MKNHISTVIFTIENQTNNDKKCKFFFTLQIVVDFKLELELNDESELFFMNSCV